MKKAATDWTDAEAEQVLQSVLGVVYSDVRKAAEADIRGLLARATTLASARPEADLSQQLAECQRMLEGEHDAHMECHRKLEALRPEARRTRVDSEMCVMAWNDLREYLLAHEGDIAHGINDFATLAAAFTDVVGRDAETHVMVSQEDGGITQALVKMARESAIEECATVCDAYAREHASGILMSMGESIHGESAGKTLAARIRDLKPRLPQESSPK